MVNLKSNLARWISSTPETKVSEPMTQLKTLKQFWSTANSPNGQLTRSRAFSTTKEEKDKSETLISGKRQRLFRRNSKSWCPRWFQRGVLGRTRPRWLQTWVISLMDTTCQGQKGSISPQQEDSSNTKTRRQITRQESNRVLIEVIILRSTALAQETRTLSRPREESFLTKLQRRTLRPSTSKSWTRTSSDARSLTEADCSSSGPRDLS